MSRNVRVNIMLHWRNSETLHRLAYLAEGRRSARTGSTSADRETRNADSGETTNLEKVSA